jgi:hypothetical protein
MWHDIQQNTDEWLALRSGKLTGSAISKVMANYPKAFGEPAKKLAVDIALAQLTGVTTESGFSNEHTERGHQQEPLARMRYQEEYFCKVTNGGFFDNGFTGCSPDGLVGDDGMVEIKSVVPSVHYKRIKSQMYDPAYRWQLVFNLKESGRDWIDFISFCATFTDDKKLFVSRMQKSEQQIAFKQMDQRIDKFKKLVEQVRLDIAA